MARFPSFQIPIKVLSAQEISLETTIKFHRLHLKCAMFPKRNAYRKSYWLTVNRSTFSDKRKKCPFCMVCQKVSNLRPKKEVCNVFAHFIRFVKKFERLRSLRPNDYFPTKWWCWWFIKCPNWITLIPFFIFRGNFKYVENTLET